MTQKRVILGFFISPAKGRERPIHIKNVYLEPPQKTTLLLPLTSTGFYPDGNSPGKTLENSGKQNPEMEFKSPRAKMPTFKWLFLNNLRSKTLGQIQNLHPHRLVSRLKSKSTPGDTLRIRPYSYRRLDPKMDIDGDGGRRDLRMKDKPHQIRRLSIRRSSSSNVMPRDGFAPNSASRRRASAILHQSESPRSCVRLTPVGLPPALFLLSAR